MYFPAPRPARQTGLLDFLLHKCEPERFPETPTEDCWYAEIKLGLIRLALRVSAETPLPTVLFQGLETWEAFGMAISQHYTANGRPLSADHTQEELQEGSYDA